MLPALDGFPLAAAAMIPFPYPSRPSLPMMRFLLPLILLLLGLSGGVGAGLVLAPSEPATSKASEIATPCGPVPEASDAAAHAPAAEEAVEEAVEHNYVRLNNQFVVPLLTEGEVDALVMLALSVEVPAGQEEQVAAVEPKLRDLFLQVLFDHANVGGFDGLYTAQSAMRELRGALRTAAQDELGALVTDVLITDLVRQDP